MPESNQTKFALLKKDISEIYKDILNFVTKSDFTAEIKRLDMRINPVEKIVYGMVGFILLGFLGAIVSFFIKK